MKPIKHTPTLRSTFAVLFYLNRSKKKKNGECPLMGRITIDAKVSQFSCKLDINPKAWDAKAARMTGKGKQATDTNRYLDHLQNNINTIYRNLVDKHGYVTAESVKNAILGVGAKANTLLALFDEHNREFKLRVGINRVQETYEMYLLSKKHLKSFIEQRYGCDDITFSRIDSNFINAYDFYLRVDKVMKLNTLLGHIIILRKIIRRAVNQSLLRKDPFVNYVAKKPLKQHRHLTAEEFERIITTPLISRTLPFTRDMFVFSSFTGLAHADLKRLSEKDLTQKADGTWWIKINRKKTGGESTIRLLDIPLAIIDKYKNERKSAKVFNVITVGCSDVNLKRIAKACQIERNLTFHMSRHNFATRVTLNEGVPIETVCRMMGHKSVRTTQIYAHITNKKVAEDMRLLSERIENRYTMPKEDIPEDFKRNQFYLKDNKVK